MHNVEESSLARLMIPDVLTPSQFHGGVRTQHPQAQAMKRLMLAVLEDALRCLQTYIASRNQVYRKAFAEAETWILDRKAQGPFAFDTICEALEIQPDHLRDGIRQWCTQLSNGPGFPPPATALRAQNWASRFARPSAVELFSNAAQPSNSVICSARNIVCRLIVRIPRSFPMAITARPTPELAAF